MVEANTHSYDGTNIAGYNRHKLQGKPLQWIFRVSDMAPDGLNAKKFYGFVVCFKLASLLFQLTDSRN